MATDDATPTEPQRTSEQLEAAARKPFAYNGPLLLELAERCRVIEAVDPERCGLRDHAQASRVLWALERAGVVQCVDTLKPRGKRDGTKLYQAP